MGGMKHECAMRVEDLGPFLIGQLSAEKSDTLKVAVARCPSCTADVDCLGPVVAAMAQSKVGVPLDADTQPRPVPEFVSARVLASVRVRLASPSVATRRRRRCDFSCRAGRARRCGVADNGAPWRDHRAIRADRCYGSRRRLDPGLGYGDHSRHARARSGDDVRRLACRRHGQAGPGWHVPSLLGRQRAT